MKKRKYKSKKDIENTNENKKRQTKPMTNKNATQK